MRPCLAGARFSQKSHAQPTRATGWVVGSHGVPWLQPPAYGSQIGNWGRIGRTRATTNKGNLASFEMRQKTFATQQQKFRQAASATGQAGIELREAASSVTKQLVGARERDGRPHGGQRGQDVLEVACERALAAAEDTALSIAEDSAWGRAAVSTTGPSPPPARRGRY